jgi:hypothetical protein
VLDWPSFDIKAVYILAGARRQHAGNLFSARKTGVHTDNFALKSRVLASTIPASWTQDGAGKLQINVFRWNFLLFFWNIKVLLK